MVRKKQKHKKGFSLIEVMLATFLVSAGLTAVMALLSVGIKGTSDSKDQVVGSFLAQEGVELVRNIRDTNWLGGEESFMGLSNGDYKIDPESSLSSTSDFGLNFYQNFYRHTGNGEETKFSRKIEIEGSDDQKIITSLVIWGDDFPESSKCNLSTKCAYSKITLTKWKEE